MRSAISERYPPAVIDAHAHLTDRRFATDVVDVLERARKAGIERVLTAAEDVASSEEALTLAAHHDDVRVAVGVHPHRAASWGPDALDRLTELQRDPRVVAIGEIGMDFSGRSSPPDVQEAACDRSSAKGSTSAGWCTVTARVRTSWRPGSTSASTSRSPVR